MPGSMRRRRIILGSALAVALVALALAWPSGPTEPVYQGKRLSQWIEEVGLYSTPFVAEYNSDIRQNALKAVRAIGTNALPWLMGEFDTPVSKWRVTVNEWVAKVRGKDAGLTKDQERRVRAYQGFLLLGSAAAPALPALYDRLGNVDCGMSAAAAMGGMGEPALPYLLRGMASTNADIERASCNGLARLAKEVPAAVPHVVPMLQHTNNLIRRDAAYALYDCRFHPELRMPALYAALSDSDRFVVAVARRAINYARGGSNNVLSELRGLLSPTNAATALAASNALFILEHPGKP